MNTGNCKQICELSNRGNFAKKFIPGILIFLVILLSEQIDYAQSEQKVRADNLFNAASDSVRKSGDPTGFLPSNIEQLTWFGERADISPDNKRIAFMAKSFGDAMVIDMQTRHISCLTCGIPGAVFLRVMHLSNGDYILIGPDHFEDTRTSRSRDNELWYLSREQGSKPVKLGQKMSEGAAVSKSSMKIAFAELHDQVPEVPEGASRIVIADIDISDGFPKLKNRKVVFESPDRSCTVEPNDFYDKDSKLTFTCYEPKDNAAVMGIDLVTMAVTNFSQAPGRYNEVEGIFPDGKFTCVESDRQCIWLGGHGSGNIDIWKLGLDGTGKNFERLTFFNNFIGGKASNPVVATNGEFMAFQAARTTEAAGVGHGILIFRFKK
jgi:Tol biopolymer transport system component